MATTPIAHNNRTGSKLREDWVKEMIEGTKEFRPTSVRVAKSIMENRALYAKDGLTIGTFPPPAEPRRFHDAGAAVSTGAAMDVFLDQLGARLAFERAGVRLYEGLIGKLQIAGGFEDGPSLEALLDIQREEAGHFGMLRDCIERIGGDSTAMTPAADVEATIGKGAADIIDDPRTNLMQALNAALVIELADNASWQNLVRLAERVGETGFAERFEQAQQTESNHLMQVQRWVNAGMEMEST